MSIKLIVFDWDGTLANSVAKIVECSQFVARRHQLPIPTEETIVEALGLAFEKAMLLCFPNVPLAKVRLFGQEFQTLMQEDYYQATLFPHAKETLLGLKKQGIYLTVATAKSRAELDKVIIFNELSGIFDMTCCGEEYQPKPHPAMLDLMLKQFSVSPHEVIMVGDTITDMQFATNAKVKSIAVTFGAHAKEALQQYTPHAVIDDWRQFLPLIG